ncbi:hypothetical protein ACUNWD_13570 [Sunxiuqinia sp. A32]|uniref:hypothetical protein n=1 Tax=Sunxiuqinia sp. A32 TaxID=3461496 RepID=UPI0040459B78
MRIIFFKKDRSLIYILVENSYKNVGAPIDSNTHCADNLQFNIFGIAIDYKLAKS